VALVLKGHPDIKKLRIEVRAEGVSKDETQRRADLVRDALVAKGIDAKRLEPVGMGTGAPKVEFLIEEQKSAPAAKKKGQPAVEPASE